MHVDAGLLASVLQEDLCRAGWDGALSTYPGQPVCQFAMSALARSFLKKYLPGTEGHTRDTDKAALDLFLKVNERCQGWKPVLDRFDSGDEIALGEAKAFLHDFFYPSETPAGREPRWGTGFQDFVLSLRNIYERLGPGPGSTIGTKATDFYSKFATSRLSCTDLRLHMMYREAISHHPTWSGLELCRDQRQGVEVVGSSRLSFVPKTTEISRTICTEPLLNMFFQMGLGRAIRDRLREFVGIDLSSQPAKNAFLARIGSETGRFGTIDLQSASDSVSMSMAEYMLPKRVFELLCLMRCGHTTLPGGKTIELHMVSSMGNAFTFPLQTLLFTAVVYGVYRALSIRLRYPFGEYKGNLGVFGDDIVVERPAFERVVKLLNFLGFTVNVDKSFNDGTFRESCGSDYYRGHGVRGVYLRRLTDAGDVYSAINRLIRWSSRHGISLGSTVRLLYRLLKRRERTLFVPFDESDDSGLKVPLDSLTTKSFGANGTVRYRYRRLKTRMVKLPLDENGSCNLPDWFYNRDGLLFAFVAGYIRNGYLALRLNERYANIRVRYTPRWDYIDSASCESVGSRVAWKRYASMLGYLAELENHS